MTAYNANRVINPDQRVLQALAGLAGHHGKIWCFPSQAKLLAIIYRLYHRKMSRRTLNRHLGALELKGFIQRVQRHKRGRNGSLELHSTLYKIKAAAVHTLSRMNRFMDIARAHKWASRWITAVPNRAQCMEQHINIISEPPKKRADSS